MLALPRRMLDRPAPLAWARRFNAVHAGDFARDIAMFGRRVVGRHGDIPGFSFARNSTAYAQNRAGQWLEFAAGQMRLTDRGLLAERGGSYTGLVTAPRDLTNAAWTKSNTTAALTQTGFRGDANSASLLTATSNAGTCLQSFTSGSAGRYFSPLVKRVTGTGTIELTLNGGTNWTDVTALINSNSFTQLGIGATLANPNIGFRLGTSGDAIAVDVAQMVAAGTAGVTALITGTGVNDVLTIPWANSGAHTLFVEAERFHGVSSVVGSDFGAALSLNDGSAANQSYISRQNLATATGFATVSSSAKGLLSKGSGASDSPAAPSRFAMAVQTNAGLGAFGGSAANGADVATAAIPATTQISIGHQGGGGAFFQLGYIRKWAIFDRALSVAELNALTATA